MKHLFEFGTPFQLGCNYWALHAGPDMWRNWDASEVEEDFKTLSAHGINILRIFPNWRDFQPLVMHAKGMNLPREIRMGEEPLPDTPEGRAGVDPVMLERFGIFLELAEKYQLKLIVGILTGWMSGRMFVPPAFEGKHLLTDPEIIHWEVRFVRTLVSRFRNSAAIVAWDPGNECNCMEQISVAEQWHWFDTIANAIRREDPGRPILSGTNSRVDSTQIPDMAEAVEVLCTHSYPAFSKYCRVDPIDTMRDSFQATFMTRCCADIGKTDVVVEETGSFGSTQNSEDTSARHLRNMLWNTYAHDCRSLLWWCAFDLTNLSAPPYDWNTMERELGLFTIERKPKSTVGEFTAFRKAVRKIDLPKFQRDAVCVLTGEQDQWSAGFLSFLLAKEAGFDIEFQLGEEELRPAPLYMLPSAHGFAFLSKHRYLALLKKVAEGASLYLSADDTGIEPWKPFGVPIRTVCEAGNEPAKIVSPEYQLDLTLRVPHEITLDEGEAEVLARDAAGHPAFTRMSYGKGNLFFLNIPLETSLAPRPRLFEPGAAEYFRIYRILAEKSGISERRVVRRRNPFLTLTEHPVSDSARYVIAVNNSPRALEEALDIRPDWNARAEHGDFRNGILRLEANSGALLFLQRQ